ncbi:hypothetical protein GCM10010178_40460 [Lentzea flava]|uniref:Uncharacterized protein n=1 Tax=Lentzea flava TaxID=103732 RepID=A0ABQ2ULL1_9PSEU|nr:hypothetical protein GCM10010178_40460 [Lentzea flava]
MTTSGMSRRGFLAAPGLAGDSPRAFAADPRTNGDITAARISVGTNGVDFTEVANVNWASGPQPEVVEWANSNGVHIGGRFARPQLVSRFPVANTVYRLQVRHSGKPLPRPPADHPAATRSCVRTRVDGMVERSTASSSPTGSASVCSTFPAPPLWTARLSTSGTTRTLLRSSGSSSPPDQERGGNPWSH